MDRKFRKFWKVICRYGHVGTKKEIAVARYLVTDDSATCLTVLQIAQTMPGTKSQAVSSIEQINLAEWQRGKAEEKSNFYLQRLFAKCPKQAS